MDVESRAPRHRLVSCLGSWIPPLGFRVLGSISEMSPESLVLDPTKSPRFRVQHFGYTGNIMELLIRTIIRIIVPY